MRKSIITVVLSLAVLAAANASFAEGGGGGSRGGSGSRGMSGSGSRGGMSGNGSSRGNGGSPGNGSSRGNGGGNGGPHRGHGGYDGGVYVVGYGSDVVVDPSVETAGYAAPAGCPSDASEDVANPVLASITLINPQSNRVPLKYRLDNGDMQTLAAGYQVQINQTCVITFDRGGSAGQAQYTMIDGTYGFQPSNGVWELFKLPDTGSNSPAVASDDSNPAPN